MKELYEKKCGSIHLILAIMDDRNYVIYDKNRPKTNKKTGAVTFDYKYYSQMPPAIREVSRVCANESCSDLASWVKELRAIHTELETIVSV